MTILIVIISIFVLTAIIWLMSKILSVAVCPICAGVSLTWLSMLAGMYLGSLSITTFQLPTAILAGGSVVGIAYKLESKLRSKSLQLLWKSLVIPLGFALVYSLVKFDWPQVYVTLLILAVITPFFLGRISDDDKDGPEDSEAVRVLKEKMKSCC